MKRFTIQGVEVRVYKTKAAMRRGANSFQKGLNDVEGCVVPVTTYRVYKSGMRKLDETIAVMFLSEEANLPLVIHESLHAATTILREQRKSLNLGSYIEAREERLAYTQTKFLQELFKHFFPKKNSNYEIDDIEEWVSASVKSTK